MMCSASLFLSINSLKLPQREYSGGISVRLIQPPSAYIKKSSAGLTAGSMSPGLIGRVLVSVGVLAPFSLLAAGLVSTAGGGPFSTGTFFASCTPGAGDLPMSGDFSGSVCACKENTLNKLTTKTDNDSFIAQS